MSGPPKGQVSAPGCRGGVCADKWVPFAAGDNLAAHHVQPMEARQLHDTALGLVSYNQAQSPLRATISRGGHRRIQHVLSQPVAEIILVGDLCLCKKNDIKAAKLYSPDGLRDPEAPAVADVEGPEG